MFQITRLFGNDDLKPQFTSFCLSLRSSPNYIVLKKIKNQQNMCFDYQIDKKVFIYIKPCSTSQRNNYFHLCKVFMNYWAGCDPWSCRGVSACCCWRSGPSPRSQSFHTTALQHKQSKSCFISGQRFHFIT